MARPKRGEEKNLKSDVRVRITEELRAAIDARVGQSGGTITDVLTPVLEREFLGGPAKRARKAKRT